MVNAVPSFEDDPKVAVEQLKAQGFQSGDFVLGFSASGTAKFVTSIVGYAVQCEGRAGLVSCNSVPKASRV